MCGFRFEHTRCILVILVCVCVYNLAKPLVKITLFGVCRFLIAFAFLSLRRDLILPTRAFSI